MFVLPPRFPQDSVTNLRTFQMAKNCLIAAGCHQVARIVARSPLLEDLKVSGTRVPSVGTLALVRTLQANAALRLRRLDLSDNSFEAADSYEALAALLAAPQVCAQLTCQNRAKSRVRTSYHCNHLIWQPLQY
jgi:Ran GTPase-activating protein (RanGAP) involved in mRNA processing and transport